MADDTEGEGADQVPGHERGDEVPGDVEVLYDQAAAPAGQVHDRGDGGEFVADNVSRARSDPALPVAMPV